MAARRSLLPCAFTFDTAHSAPSSKGELHALTTVEQPAHRLGMVAARMLFDLIDDGELLDGIPQEIVLVPKLKVRNSCGNRNPINTLVE